jgi:UDP-N-acetylmuramoyl-L-alanyl-D-glutamate--2,6-diaminopimelate ligase
MRLDEVLAGGEGEFRDASGEVRDIASALGEVEIAGLAYDSRAVAPGSLFFCVTGFQSDGHDFAGQAVARGAAALVVERPLGLGVPEMQVPSARAAMGPAAVRFYRDPSAELQVVGVTGTNGKTTTAFLLKALLEASGGASGAGGRPDGGCGLLGTVKSVIGGVERGGRDDPIQRTTPEAIDLQADFRAMLDGGDRACAMEVSSHALELGRADGIHFAAAIFTNLTQDHLDFHASMEDYFQAKRRLFVPPSAPAPVRARGIDERSSMMASESPGVSVVNVGDSYGRRLAGELDGAITFAVEEVGDGGAAATADYRASGVRCDFAGCHFTLHTPAAEREVALPLAGRFNVANALGALAAAHTLGGELDALVGALERGVSVPGRMESVDAGQDFAVLVDYAHTPDSLQNVLRAARELTGGRGLTGAGEPRGVGEHGRGRVVCVFGAGGDRDRGKRPLMGEIAAQLADVVAITSDNPRSEDPDRIIAEILAGTAGIVRPQGAQPVRAIPDRRQAIYTAIEGAATGDVVVIAGKGHEQGQEFENGRKLPFDDVSVAREALRARSGTTAAGVQRGARDDVNADARAGAGA